MTVFSTVPSNKFVHMSLPHCLPLCRVEMGTLAPISHYVLRGPGSTIISLKMGDPFMKKVTASLQHKHQNNALGEVGWLSENDSNWQSNQER